MKTGCYLLLPRARLFLILESTLFQILLKTDLTFIAADDSVNQKNRTNN